MRGSQFYAIYLLFFLSSVSFSNAETTAVSFWKTIRTYDQIERVGLFTKNYQKKNQNGKNNILADELSIKMTAFETNFNFELQINEDLFTKDAVIRVFTDDGRVEESKPFITSFKGKLSEERAFRFTVLDFENGIVSGYFHHSGDIYYVEPLHEDHMPENVKRSMAPSTRMIVYRASDLFELTTGTEDEIAASKRQLLTANQLRQPPLPPSQVPGCIGSLRRMTLNFASDYGYTTARGGVAGATNDIQAILSTLTAVYEYTVAIRLVIATMEIMAGPNSAPPSGPVNWNVARPGCPDIRTLLDRFTDYVRARKSGDGSGSWQLMTDCNRGQLIAGVAWRAALCSPWKAGVNTFVGQNTWTLVAHELGHNFDAPHTFPEGNQNDPSPSNEGIMSYKGNAAAFTRNSQTSMCRHIGTVGNCFSPVACSGSCPTTGKPCGEVCGTRCGSCNGANGEVCNPATNLCVQQCTPNCANAQCGSNGCGGTCGTCAPGSSCDGNRRCISTADISSTVLTRLNAERARVGSRSLTYSNALQGLAANSGCTIATNAAISSAGYGETLLSCAGCSVAAYVDYIINTIGKGWSCASTTSTIYTQAIWDSTTQVGCAIVRNCPNGGSNGDLFRCVWSPAGNQLGKKPVPSCNCQPTTNCQAQERTCGTLWNGCENVDCGRCSNSAPCSAAGKCECVPKTSCAGLCGRVSDGCGGTLNCPACPTPTACIPQSVSQACGQRNCGTRGDGCGGTVTCGACSSSNPVCQNGICANCTDQCASTARCDPATLKCVCRPGFQGNGLVCNPTSTVPPGPPSLGDLGWKVIFDTTPTAWRLTNDQIWHEPNGKTAGPNPHNIVQWDDSLQFTSATTVTFSVWAYKFDATSTAGLALKLLNSGNMLYAYWSQTAIKLRWLFNQPGYLVENRDVMTLNLQAGSQWNANSWKQLTVTVCGNKYTFETGPGSFTTATIVLPSFPVLPGAGPFSLVSAGPIIFGNVSLATTSKVRLSLFGCLTSAQFKERAARLLNIPGSSITNVVAKNGCAIGNKRQETAGELVTYEVEFTGTSEAESSASAMEGVVESGDPALVENDLAIEEATTVETTAPEATLAVEVAPVATAAAGLGVGAIAGIVIGSVVGVAAIGAVGAGTAIAIKKRRANTASAPSPAEPAQAAGVEPPNTAPPEPKYKKGVNLYTFNPDQITSITARSPPQKV